MVRKSEQIQLIKAEYEALTIRWPEIPDAISYTLEYQRASLPRYARHQWTTLSRDLDTTEVRKKSLRDDSGQGFRFRVGAKTEAGQKKITQWITHDYPFTLKDQSARIRMIETSQDSITVTWPRVPKAERYVLEFRPATDYRWTVLSDSLTKNQARKKNLEDFTRQGFFFRVTPYVQGQKKPFFVSREPFKLMEEDIDDSRMESPSVKIEAGAKALISWKPAQSIVKPSNSSEGANYRVRFVKESDKITYDLQMREDVGGRGWKTIATALENCQVRKKNLTSRYGYQFRVRPSRGLTPYSQATDIIHVVDPQSKYATEDVTETCTDYSESFGEVIVREVPSAAY